MAEYYYEAIEAGTQPVLALAEAVDKSVAAGGAGEQAVMQRLDELEKIARSNKGLGVETMNYVLKNQLKKES